ncbi:retrovirus-related pol polyprotein from transposon TNT 1-94 [Tanacetum coccineum]|uniref:Retrovirus-related pol polyprotein from transposon TNT 1-94 n=1 Tax=Tanacetum coccineum TaxID=301880 RepID=A0ABQ5FQX7_9ASTR
MVVTDLVRSFEGPLDTKENRIMDLKLEYQTFRAKPTESLSQTYTRYKTLLNKLANDGVNLSKHEINVGFVNSLPEKWLTFSQGLGNANHTQTLDLADIYERFVYEDNLIQRMYSDTKKALITTPSSTAISSYFFSNNVVQDFQENSDDEVDERSSEEYLRDLDIEFHERALLANSKCHFVKECFSKASEPSYKSLVTSYSSVSKGFQPKFTSKCIQFSQFSSSQAEPKIQKDYKAEYMKMKAKLALLKASPSTSQTPKTFQPKNKADDDLTVRKNHARNGEWIDITMRKVSQCINEQIPHQKKKVLGGELFSESSSKINENENLFNPASMGFDHEMVLKSKEWVERLNPENKLLNFNTRKILVPESQAMNESLKPTETSTNPELSKDSEAESLTLPPLKSLQGAPPSLEVMSLTFQPHSPKEIPGLGIMKHTKPETQDSLNKSALRTVTVSKTEPTTPSVPTERHIREPIWYLDSGCSRSITGVKSYLHKYVEQPDPKFDDKQETIFNANKEIVLIAPRRNDVNVLDMSSLSHLNFKNINKSAKQNKVLGLPSLVYSKDKPCSACEKGKHHRASFKTSLSGKNSDILYYVIPHGHSLTELTQEKHVPEMIAPNEPDIPHTKDVEGPLDLINTEGTHEKNVQDEKIITQSTEGPSGNNTKVSVWSKDKHIELVNIIGDPGKGMLTRSMAVKLTAASASECLFADFLSEIEPKKMFEALKHPGWVDAIQEELNQFYRNKVWTLVPLPYGKTAICSKWVFRNKKDEHGMTTKNKARLVAQGYSQKEGIDYDETFASVARMKSIRIFLDFATYMNFIVFQMDIKSAFINGKLKEEVYVKQPPGFESSEFPDYVYKLDKTLYGLKQAPRTCSSKQLRSRFAGKPVNETSYREMIGSLMYLTTTRPDIQFSIVLYYAGCNMERKSTSGACQILSGKLVCWSVKKQQSVTMSSAEAEYVVAAGCCTSILLMKSQLSDYDIHYKMVPIFCYNTSAIAISNNLVLYLKIKHIDIRYHLIRNHILKGDIELHFIPTEYQLADIFTKPLDEPTFIRLKAELGMLNIN